MSRMSKRSFEFLSTHKTLTTVSLLLMLTLASCFLYLSVLAKTTVPGLVGRDFEEARGMAAAAALKFRLDGRKFSSKYAAGKIISQSPQRGKRVPKQSTVRVVVSKGPRNQADLVSVPNVVELAQVIAKAKLEKAGLRVEIEEKESALPAGVVIWQLPAAGVKIKKGAVIKLAVSKGTPGAQEAGGKIVCIDAGHQAKGDSRREPIGPGSKTTKERVRGGASGVSSGTPEHEITLSISLKLKSLLQEAGYQVVMVRETHDVNISASERAQIANNVGADLFVRIHCDGSSNSATNGISTLYPALNQWTGPIYDESKQAAQIIQGSLVRICKRADRGAIARGDITGFNWSKVPVVLVESGFLSNPTEDAVLNSQDGKSKVAQGIFEGVVDYFKEK